MYKIIKTINSCVDYLKNKNIIDVSKSNINDYKNIPLMEWTNKPTINYWIKNEIIK